MIKRLKQVIVFVVLGVSSSIVAQSHGMIQFELIRGSKAILLSDSHTKLPDSTSIELTSLKFYVSRIQLLNAGKIVFEELNSYHLIDASELYSQKIELVYQKEISADQILFYLGIDSVTNVSGALSGVLDPTKGMYWTWQSGYINFKLEGRSKLCNSRNNEFQFHLGGYQQPFYCLQLVKLPVKQTGRITICLDIDKLLNQLELSKQHHIMSPARDAVILSKEVANSFSIVEK